MNRWKAATIHLSISLVLATLLSAVLYFLWFPQPYFIAAGASSLIILLLGVDIGIGPLLTLIVVSPHKSQKLLKLDLSVIAMLQVAALAYGVYVIAAARPIFLVAAVDRFVLVSADDVSNADLALGDRPAFRTRSWSGPVIVGVQPSGVGFDAMTIMASGKDLAQLPKYYVPYEKMAAKVMLRAKPLSSVRTISAYQQRQLRQALTGAGHDTTLVALPLQRNDRFYTAIMSSKTQRPVRIISVDPL